MIRPGVVRALLVRDLRAQLRAPRLYVVASLYLLLQGFLFGVVYLRAPESAYRDLARVLTYGWVLLGPALAAGALAGERETHELDPLRDEPVAEGELVAAKALALGALVLALAGSYALPAGLAARLAPVPGAVLVCAGAGLVLVALAAGAVGLLASAIAGTTASALTLGVALVALVGGGVAGLGRGLDAGDPLWLLEPFLRGVLDVRPLLLLPAVTLGALVVAARVLAAGRAPPVVDPETGARLSAAAELGTWALRVATKIGPAALAAAALVVAGARLDAQRDLSGYLELAPATVARLEGLTQEVEVFVVPGEQGRRAVDDLLDEVARAGGGRVKVQPLDAAAFQARLRPLGLLVPPAAGLVVRVGNELRTLGGDDLDVRSGAAEAALERTLGALVTPGDRARIVFSEGHRERSLAPTPMDGPISLATWTSQLEIEGFRAQAVWLPEAGAAIGPGVVLAVVGPRDPFTPKELAVLRRHAEAGNPVLLALDPEHPATNAPLLAAVGMAAEEGQLVSPVGTLAGGGPTSLLLAPRAEDPLGAQLGELRVVVPGAMGLRAAPGTIASALLRTPDETRRVALDGDPRDRRQWVDPGARVVAMTRRGPGRVGVIADADLAGDGMLNAHPGNGVFLSALVCWLAERPLPAAATQLGLRTRRAVTEAELSRLTRGVGVAPAALVLLAGLGAWLGWRRRVGTRARS